MDNNKTLSDIEQLLLPYVPEKKGQIFFKVFSLIEESKSGRLAKEQAGEKCVPVFSRGVVYDSEHGNHQIIYEHSHRMSNGYEYKTHLGRELNDLSNEEIQRLYVSIKENVQKEKMIPAVIVEDYDEDIGIEDHSFYAVSFDKPYDQEQGDMSECYDCEDVDIANNKYIFMDYDDAVGFAHENIRVLEARNSFCRMIDDNDQISFHVTFETDDPRLKDIAARYGAEAVYLTKGTPLVKAVFPNLRTAREYRADVRSLLSVQEGNGQSARWQERLNAAGIREGSRFRIGRLSRSNDVRVKSIDLEKGNVVCYHPYSATLDLRDHFTVSIDELLEKIRFGSKQWIQTDGKRNPVVVLAARVALLERASSSGIHECTCICPEQVCDAVP